MRKSIYSYAVNNIQTFLIIYPVILNVGFNRNS